MVPVFYATEETECNACLWIQELLSEKEFIPLSALRVIVELRRKDWKIQPGDLCLKFQRGEEKPFFSGMIAHEVAIEIGAYPEENV